MLKVTVELIPFGVEEEKSVLATLLIANIKTGMFNDYAFVLSEEKPLDGKPIHYSGIIKDYYRQAPVVDLVYKVLEAYKGKTAYSADREWEKEVVAHLEEKSGL